MIGQLFYLFSNLKKVYYKDDLVNKLGKTYCSGCLHVFDDDDMGLVNGSKDDPDSLI